ncbi:MAG: exodeoxyribonuclease VII small subunit [Dehalococcoidia bacterium]|jgi:exodeoxyribonuclease VII small subunit|nr:exodeoxyribonuclease VII small subunit [Dehalococcoidia bacterium]
MDEQLSFEDALNRLEQISQSLERGGLRLEEGIALFEEGIRLAKICNERLNSAELKISQIQNFSEQELESKDESP